MAVHGLPWDEDLSILIVGSTTESATVADPAVSSSADSSHSSLDATTFAQLIIVAVLLLAVVCMFVMVLWYVCSIGGIGDQGEIGSKGVIGGLRGEMQLAHSLSMSQSTDDLDDRVIGGMRGMGGRGVGVG